MKRQITKQWLTGHNACKEACDWIDTQNTRGENTLIETALKDDNKLNWVNWYIVRRMTHKQQIRYVIYAAEQVISIYEQKYPQDTRPRETITAAKSVLKNNTAETRNAADAAAYAAYAARNAAAYVAYAATYAADAAAYAAYAAGNAAYAADAAGNAMDAAAYAAYAAGNAAAHAAMKRKIILNGIKILKLKIQ